MLPVRETNRIVPLPCPELVLAMARSVRKKVLFAPCSTPATGMTMASPPEYPNWRDQSTTLQLSPLRLSTGVAYARNFPLLMLLLVKIAEMVPGGAALLTCNNPKGPTESALVPSVAPAALTNSAQHQPIACGHCPIGAECGNGGPVCPGRIADVEDVGADLQLVRTGGADLVAAHLTVIAENILHHVREGHAGVPDGGQRCRFLTSRAAADG